MIEIVSVVAFSSYKRVEYLKRSFVATHEMLKGERIRHIVIDGSTTRHGQEEIYNSLGVEVHWIQSSYGERLKIASELLRTEYFLFLPDDYTWTLDFPLATVIEESKEMKVDEVKLSPRGMKWYSQVGALGESWHRDGKAVAGGILWPAGTPIALRILHNFYSWWTGGEKFVREGNFFLSNRRFRRSFHEQFSLGCNIVGTKFFKYVLSQLKHSKHLLSPGMVERACYRVLFGRKPRIGYFLMSTPTVHFLDLAVEGESQANKLQDMLITENFDTFNHLNNHQLMNRT